MDRVFVGLLLIFAGISTLASPIRVGFLLDLEVAPANINSPQQSTWADFKAQLEVQTIGVGTPADSLCFTSDQRWHCHQFDAHRSYQLLVYKYDFRPYGTGHTS